MPVLLTRGHKLSIGELVESLMLIYETLEPGDMMNHIEYL